MFNFVKTLLPKGLLGRTLTILMAPLILVQLISAIVFYNNHWEAISKRLAMGIAGDVLAVIDLLQDFPDPAQRSLIMGIANSRMDLLIKFRDNSDLPLQIPVKPLTGRDLILSQALAETLRHPFTVNTHGDRHYGVVRVQLDHGLLEVFFPKKRLYSFTVWLFLTWMGGTSIVLMGIATLFMRNQVRAVLRLASAADGFGKGLDTPTIKLEGASEVRQAASAFNLMRQRIARQIQQRTSMLAGVSHDLRTPLTRMRLQLAMMEDVEGVEDLTLDISEMERMIEGYLAFTRGEGTEKPESGDIAAVVTEVAAGFQRQGHIVSTSGAASIPLIFRPDVMRRAFGNLIGNAVRYADNVAVSIQTVGAFVEVIIDDDGPGIPSGLREEVFKPFKRLEESRNQETGGVGLGLTIAQDVVRGHGGDIALAESPMGGLRVIVRLPL